MSRELTAWIENDFRSNASIVALVGKDSNNFPAIFPYHHRDTDERIPYPHITICRFGSVTEQGKFDETQWATRMDNPRMAICVWSLTGVDECWKIYNLCDSALRPSFEGGVPVIANAYFGAYRVKRTGCRDDLFDNNAKAFHLHAEYSVWLQKTGVPSP